VDEDCKPRGGGAFKSPFKSTHFEAPQLTRTDATGKKSLGVSCYDDLMFRISPRGVLSRCAKKQDSKIALIWVGLFAPHKSPEQRLAVRREKSRQLVVDLEIWICRRRA